MEKTPKIPTVQLKPQNLRARGAIEPPSRPASNALCRTRAKHNVQASPSERKRRSWPQRQAAEQGSRTEPKRNPPPAAAGSRAEPRGSPATPSSAGRRKLLLLLTRCSLRLLKKSLWKGTVLGGGGNLHLYDVTRGTWASRAFVTTPTPRR